MNNLVVSKMENNEKINIHDFISSDLKKHNDFEDKIEELMRDSRTLYWDILDCKVEEIDDIDKDYLGVLEMACCYIHSSHDQLCKDLAASHTYNKENSNILYKVINIFKSGDARNMKYANIYFPILTFAEIKHQVNVFKDINMPKIIFAFFASILTFLFGTFALLDKVLIGMACFHFILRCIANKNKENDKYNRISKNIQLFLWPFILLAVGNLLSYVVIINGVPDGTLLSMLKIWLIYGEYVGFIDNAEKANLPVPGIFKKLADKKVGNDKLFLF